MQYLEKELQYGNNCNIISVCVLSKVGSLSLFYVCRKCENAHKLGHL